MVLSAACYKFQRLGQCHHRHSLLPHGDRPHGLGENQRGEERLGLLPSAKARNRALGGVLVAYQLDLFAILQCGACDGSLEYLGRTERDRLIKEHEACPCDDRCTSARGPNCSCRCGGQNHGSNLTVTVRTDEGGIPVAMIDPAARFKAEEYRAA